LKLLKTCILFYIGGAGYMILEFLWRGRSHGSMFLLGGLCFLLVGGCVARIPRLPLALRLLTGAVLITALELLTGLLANRDYSVWDYRNQLYHLQGQICLRYSLLWIPISFLSMWLYDFLHNPLERRLQSRFAIDPLF